MLAVRISILLGVNHVEQTSLAKLTELTRDLPKCWRRENYRSPRQRNYNDHAAKSKQKGSRAFQRQPQHSRAAAA